MDIKKLRQKILDLAIHGKLVPQDPNDEPASVLLERIRAEKEALIKEGKIKRSKKSASSDMPHYENVPFEVPEGWCWCRLENSFELLSGQDFPPEKYNDAQKGIPYIIGASNIYKGKIVINRWTQTPSVKTAKGDLLVVCKGAGVGKMALNDIGEMHIARQIQAIRDVSQMMSIEYVKMVVSYYIEDIIADANGLIPGLKRELLLSLMMPIPPLQEQRRIIATYEQLMSFIESIDNESSEVLLAINKSKSKILDLAIHGKLVPQDPNDEPAAELLKRINPKAVVSCDNPHYENVPFRIPSNWMWVKLGDIAQSNIGLTYKPTDISNDGVPVMRSNNIKNGVICNDDIVRVNTKLLDSQLLNNGDLLICARNGSKKLVGKCALVSNLQETTSFGAFMAVCRSDMNNWLYHVLSSDYFKNYLDDSNSTTIHQVTQKMLLAFDIPFPPLSEQKRICKRISELYNTIDDITDALS